MSTPHTDTEVYLHRRSIYSLTPVRIRADLRPEQLITGCLSRHDREDWHPMIFPGSIIYNLAHYLTTKRLPALLKCTHLDTFFTAFWRMEGLPCYRAWKHWWLCTVIFISNHPRLSQSWSTDSLVIYKLSHLEDNLAQWSWVCGEQREGVDPLSQVTLWGGACHFDERL